MFTSISKILSEYSKSDIKSESGQKKLLGFTVKASIAVQIITGVITFGAVFFKLAPKDMILHDIVLMETIVQFIELAFYIFISYYLVKISVTGVTPLRYFDWVFTTPTMLLSTIMFFDYKNKQTPKNQDQSNESMATINSASKNKKNQKNQENESLSVVRFVDFVKDNWAIILRIFAYNFLMLMFGYLGEIGKLNLYGANALGFIFFGLTFYTMWNNYVKGSTVAINYQLFYFMFVVWALYGVAALISPILKNIGYNFLDIIAKNFYGLFIFYQMYLTRI